MTRQRLLALAAVLLPAGCVADPAIAAGVGHAQPMSALEWWLIALLVVIAVAAAGVIWAAIWWRRTCRDLDRRYTEASDRFEAERAGRRGSE